MIELFSIYKLAFILSPLAAGLLSVMGMHLVSRNQGLQLMALSQAALLGHLLGDVFEHSPLSFICSVLLFLIVKFSFHFFKVAQDQSYIVFYLGLLALSYALTSLFPVLDSHFNAGFFGDIVSITNQKAILFIISFIILSILFCLFNKVFIRSTLSRSLLNINKSSIWEELFFMSGILIALYGLSFLFTLSFLIFPVLIAGRHFKNLSSSFIYISIASALAAFCGLSLSIVFDRVSTVPTQILLLILFMFITRFSRRPS